MEKKIPLEKCPICKEQKEVIYPSRIDGIEICKDCYRIEGITLNPFILFI